MQLLQSMTEAAQSVVESLRCAQSANSTASESKLAWFFGIGNSVDYNASRSVADLFCCCNCDVILSVGRKIGWSP